MGSTRNCLHKCMRIFTEFYLDEEGVDDEEEARQESDLMSACAESQEELSQRVKAQATKAMASFKQKTSHKRVSFFYRFTR